MTKKDELADPNSCLNKADDDAWDRLIKSLGMTSLQKRDF